MKKIKSLAIMLMVTMFFSILPTNVLAKGISKNVKSSTSTTRTFAPIIPKTSEPPVPGSGDIVAFDTKTTYVTQSTPVSLIFNIVFSVLVAEGFAKIKDSKVATAIASILVTSTSSLVMSVFTYTVKIVMNRYYVRGADGVVRYQVYATYYDNSYGGLLGSQIVQQGVV